MAEVYSKLADQLKHSGIGVCPDFLGARELDLVRNDIAQLRQAGAFRKAGVGKGLNHTKGQLVREDETLWLERGSGTAPQEILWSHIDKVQQALNRDLYLGINSFEGHYAVYPAGGYYQRHFDTFRNSTDRVVSLVLYLNLAWQPSHGGCLRIYEDESARDIEPIGGTLVCFLSEEFEHEVLESHKERMSFTGWFKKSNGVSIL